MSETLIQPDSGSAPNGTALALLRIPHCFSQAGLLNTEEFLKEAKLRGFEVDLDQLQSLYHHRLLIPMYRVGDTESLKRQIAVNAAGGMNTHGRTIDAAQRGTIHDCAEEGWSASSPFQKPAEVTERNWWNGFVYSSWQLPDLNFALQRLILLGQGEEPSTFEIDFSLRGRKRAIALSALSTHFLPEILGTLTLTTGDQDEEVWSFRSSVQVSDLLVLSGFEPKQLSADATWLLGNAGSRDPMSSWWPLIRHSRGQGWEKLGGVTRDCVWQRVAAEVLLRAHEELASDDLIGALPDLNLSKWRNSLHDRVTPRESNTKPLEFELAEYNLSPHPRVLLLVEGQTEMIQIPRLLAQFGLDESNRVRVQNCHSSEINPQLISRYAITPRLGPKYGEVQLVAPPTALVIAMDPEGRWSTSKKRKAERRSLQSAIREEVEWQYRALAETGSDSHLGTIKQEDLDFLVTIFVWGDDKYELANFTDDELFWALTVLAEGKTGARTGSPSWESEVRSALKKARAKHYDIGVTFKQLRIREDKVGFSEILWPLLLEKLEKELSTGEILTPVVQLVQKVRELDSLLSGRSYSLSN
ncbi:MAG: hypothetical protein Q8L08_07205 [Candidatus Nanopelagicaceae bacterium]|nr:hypothetical protein [Candidatus Nanopelagicaceae bacterium]